MYVVYNRGGGHHRGMALDEGWQEKRNATTKSGSACDVRPKTVPLKRDRFEW